MKSRIIGIGIIASLMLAVSACGASGGGSGGGSSIRLVIGTGNFDELPDWIALDKGFFKDHGLTMKVDQVESGPTELKTLIGHQADIATSGGTALVQAVASGADLKFIASELQTTPYVIASKPSLTNISQLKGKTFAVSEFGSSSDAAARAALKADGLAPGKDVQMLQLGSNSQRLAGVARGSATATDLSPDQQGEMAKAGLHVLQNLLNLHIETVHLALCTSQSFLDAHPGIGAKVRAAIAEALNYIKDPANKDDVLKVIAKWEKASVNDSDVQDTYRYYQSTKGLRMVYPPQAKMLTHALKNDIATTAQTDKSAAKLTPGDVVAKGDLANG